MKIQEVEQRTGLDRATIRFYEKESLICPARLENGYRQYSEEDVRHLQKIRLLRQLGMSLEQIQQLQQGSAEISEALDTQIRILGAQIQSKQRSVEVCHELKKDGVTYENMDAVHYLRLLRDGISAPGAPSVPKPLPFREPVSQEVHPVRRYVARMLDINLFVTAVYALLFLVIRLRPIPTGTLGNLISWGLWLVWMPLEALLLSIWGSTPGKWIMGIRLEYCEGGKLTFSQALDRVWRIFVRGIGYGIPLWSQWRLFKSYQFHSETAETEWDDETEVIYTPWGSTGKGMLAAAAGVILALTIWIAVDSYLPRYRTDEMTIAQFAENYNYYQYVRSGTADQNNRLQPDGKKPETPDNSVVIYIDGEPEVENQNFVYETEDGIIRRITYENSWTNVFARSPLVGNCDIAAMAAVLGQEDMQYKDVNVFLELWEAETAQPEGEIEFCGVTIRWSVTAENLELRNGMYFAIDEDLPNRLSLEYEIVFQNSGIQQAK